MHQETISGGTAARGSKPPVAVPLSQFPCRRSPVAVPCRRSPVAVSPVVVPLSQFPCRRSQRATEERNTSSGQQQLPWSSGTADSSVIFSRSSFTRWTFAHGDPSKARPPRSPRRPPPGIAAPRPRWVGGRHPFNVSEVGPGRVRAQRPRARGLSERKGGAQRRLGASSAAPSDASTRAPRPRLAAPQRNERARPGPASRRPIATSDGGDPETR